MDKETLQDKINAWWKDYDRYVISIPALIAAVWLTVKLIRKFSCSYQGRLISILILVLWGLFIARYIGPVIGRWFGKFVLPQRDKSKIPPQVLSPVNELAADNQYGEAVKQLNAVLKKYPFNPEASLALIKIYAQKLNNDQLALALIEEYFTQEKVITTDENIEMLLIYSDICREAGMESKGRRLLEYELKRKGYSDTNRKHLLVRLTTQENPDSLS